MNIHQCSPTNATALRLLPDPVINHPLLEAVARKSTWRGVPRENAKERVETPSIHRPSERQSNQSKDLQPVTNDEETESGSIIKKTSALMNYSSLISLPAPRRSDSDSHLRARPVQAMNRPSLRGQPRGKVLLHIGRRRRAIPEVRKDSPQRGQHTLPPWSTYRRPLHAPSRRNTSRPALTAPRGVKQHDGLRPVTRSMSTRCAVTLPRPHRRRVTLSGLNQRPNPMTH